MNSTIKELLSVGSQNFLPALSVDCVIFGYHENQLKILMVKHRDQEVWALPGGFIYKNEPIDAAANRVLKERTGLDEVFLQQFYVFGEPTRSEKEFHLIDLDKEGIKAEDDLWLLQRFVTIGFYALVDFSTVKLSSVDAAEKCIWRTIDELPKLMLDHRKIINKALITLRLQLNSQPVGYNLLPEKFTMSELQKLYETILDKNLDRRNFQRKILNFGILQRHEETKKGLPHKSPFLYSFDLEKYKTALEDGFNSGW